MFTLLIFHYMSIYLFFNICTWRVMSSKSLADGVPVQPLGTQLIQMNLSIYQCFLPVEFSPTSPRQMVFLTSCITTSWLADSDTYLSIYLSIFVPVEFSPVSPRQMVFLYNLKSLSWFICISLSINISTFKVKSSKSLADAVPVQRQVTQLIQYSYL